MNLSVRERHLKDGRVKFWVEGNPAIWTVTVVNLSRINEAGWLRVGTKEWYPDLDTVRREVLMQFAREEREQGEYRNGLKDVTMDDVIHNLS